MWLVTTGEKEEGKEDQTCSWWFNVHIQQNLIANSKEREEERPAAKVQTQTGYAAFTCSLFQTPKATRMPQHLIILIKIKQVFG